MSAPPWPASCSGRSRRPFDRSDARLKIRDGAAERPLGEPGLARRIGRVVREISVLLASAWPIHACMARSGAPAAAIRVPMCDAARGT